MYKFCLFACLLFVFASCKKQSDEIQTASISDYYPLEVGKYIDYNLDSSVFINFGQKDTVIHYMARDVVDATTTDNLNRPSFRIIRYLRQSESEEWTPSATYMVTPTNGQLEVIENNLRFIKLMLPIKQDFSWKGNKYIDTYSTNFEQRYLDDWDYIYDSVGAPLTINDISFDSTIKVFERDEFLGQDPSIPGTQYAEKNFGVEKYAKGVGLIYRELIHWEYQGAQPGRTAYFAGFGIKMTITGHN